MSDRTLQVGVKAVVQDADGRILMLQRKEPYHGEDFLRWDVPGGRIDVGEPILDALRREVKEETGLDVTEIGQPFHAQDILHNPKLHVVRITYPVKVTGEITIGQNPSDEHSEFRWFQRDEIPVGLTDKFFVAALEANGWI